MKKTVSIHAWLLLPALILLGACDAGKSSREKPNQGQEPSNLSESDRRVIMTIDKQASTNLDLKQYIQIHYGKGDQFGDNPASLSRIFDRFVEHHLLLHAADQHRVDVDQAEIDDYGKQIDLAEDQPELLDSVRIQKFLYLTVYRDITVSDAEIQRYYIEHQDQFRKREEVELYQILLKDRETATRISGILKNYPRRFEEIAREESLSIEAERGGFMGHFEKGSLPVELEDVVFSLKLNEISPVVESTFGFHVFKVTGKRKQRQMPFSTVRDEIRKTLLSDKLRSAYRAYVDTLRRSGNLSIDYDALYFNYQTTRGDIDENTE